LPENSEKLASDDQTNGAEAARDSGVDSGKQPGGLKVINLYYQYNLINMIKKIILSFY
jgi:hypothetical protein